MPALHSTSRFRRCRPRDDGTRRRGPPSDAPAVTRAYGRRCLMPRTVRTAPARKAAERTTTAGGPAKSGAKRAVATAAAAKTPAQNGTGTSKDVMQTVQTEPAPEEIAEIAGVDGLDAEAEAAALMSAET